MAKVRMDGGNSLVSKVLMFFRGKMEGLRGLKKTLSWKSAGASGYYSWMRMQCVKKKLQGARIEEIVNTKQAKNSVYEIKLRNIAFGEGNKARRMGRLRDKAVEKWGCENQ